MKFFVLDCSVTMAWCFEDEKNDFSDKLLKSLNSSKAIVPAVWSLEVQNVLYVAERKKRISREQSTIFINFLNELPIEIDLTLSDFINKKILEISRKYSISAYDAAYLELALRKDIPFASLDKMLNDASKKAGVSIRP